MFDVFCENVSLKVMISNIARKACTKMSTVIFTDLDHGTKMIIFLLNLTSFTARFVFESAGAVTKIGPSLISNHY